MRVVLAVLLTAVALALGACGESSEEKAKSTVCDARSDIATQVDKLKGLEISTAAVDQAQASLEAIGDDLAKIKDAQGDLADDRRRQVQAANQAFATQVESITSKLGSGLSLSTAKTQLSSAVQQLGTAYQQTFAKIDCS